MKLNKISQIKNKLKNYLKNKEILDIIVFGSTIKGKSLPRDIDIAIITEKDISIPIPEFHVSIIKPKDFFVNIPSLINTLLREGYSLKHDKYLAETYKFSNKVLFTYQLTNLNSSRKVKIVNFLRGKNNQTGLVKQNQGEWLANQVFVVPIETDYLFEQFFLNLRVKYQKSFILIH
ncbi:MAG: nucleotidyltransferase domain-containing protein [Candidatus Pacearchaeota archaeon]